MSVFLFLALEFEVASDLYRIRRSRFFFTLRKDRSWMSSAALFTTIPMGRANPCAIGLQIQITVPEQTYIFSPDTSCLGYSIKCQTMGVLEIIWAQRHTASCTSQHYSRWLLGVFCPPKGSINARALSLVPGCHSFPKWAIAEPGPRLRSILLPYLFE